MINNKVIAAIFSLLFLALSSISSYGQDDDRLYANGEAVDLEKLVSERWFVKFREPKEGEQPIIWKGDRAKNLRSKVPFGENSTGQSALELEIKLNLDGMVLKIYESTGMAHVKMSAKEAERLRRHPDVLWVEPEAIYTVAGSQSSPGWALGRIGSPYPSSSYTNYSWTYTGAGQTVYVLDSGLNVGTASVTAEFGSRASVIHDFNVGGVGEDCLNHGTPVSSLIAGNRFGVAKGATIIMAKITEGCSKAIFAESIIESLNWLAANAPAGTIVHIGAVPVSCGDISGSATKEAVISAANAGIMVINPAGNDNCNVSGPYAGWLSIPQTFVVGALDTPAASLGIDMKDSASNWGSNISAWAPGAGVFALGIHPACSSTASSPCTFSGTSFAGPLVAGIAAVACQAAAGDCALYSVLDLYTVFRNSGTMGTVKEAGGGPLTSSPSRVVWQQW
ncbi:MAG: S8 family serine peptidase [Pseudomonadales bacterium]|jgi:serine protease|nr:S8 family serine peptidase [Pseudomonadales bacterium]